ncbi:hypothetical protein FNU76_04425 [Chitinimonas arctica]|uniref:Uncharacterized protein n=2 Tax=Chitinimonas arctica TaxID=2594795 RepID=A0A516SBY2_9NEIS|nr:hypothetical protein FNU76_04425 [Chitinimonas arctica]
MTQFHAKVLHVEKTFDIAWGRVARLLKALGRLLVLLAVYQIGEESVASLLADDLLGMALSVAITMGLIGISGWVKWPEAAITLFFMEIVYTILVLMMMNVDFFLGHLSLFFTEWVTHGVMPVRLLAGVLAYCLGKHLRSLIDRRMGNTI